VTRVAFEGDLICWDFGDTLVDQNFMRVAPPDVPEWTTAYERVRARTDQGDRWDVADSTMRELAVLVADEIGISRARAWRQLAHNLTTIDWYPEVRELVERLDGQVLQAIVTVNPHEFWAMAVACGMHEMFDCIVTSADVDSLSKVVMVEEARSMLGLPPGLDTTLLVDNMAHNIDEFEAAGGQGWLFERATFAARSQELLAQ